MTALGVGAATPVGAQFGVLEVNPHEGPVGSVVEGLVDTAVVEESCITTIEETQALFMDPDDPTALGPVPLDWVAHGPLVGLGDTGDDFILALFFGPPPDTDGYQILAAGFLLLAMTGGLGPDPETAADYLTQTFVLTFADLQTQEPVGGLSSFDPNTGIGEVDVPNVAPGLWAVAATCVWPVVTDESFLAAVDVGATWLQDNGMPLWEGDWVDPNGVSWSWNFPLVMAAAATPWVAPEMLPELMVPQPGAGPWVDIYCIVEADGQCHPHLRDLTLAELEALEEDGLLGELLGDEVPATPVGASPRFTG